MIGEATEIDGVTGVTRHAAPKPVLLDRRYLLLETIGRGITADVWRARDVRSGSEVAVKILRDDAPPMLRERFLDEARHVDDARNPRVPAVLAVYDSPDLAYIVLALVRGDTLADRIRREGALEPHVAARIVADVALALDEAHANGVLHLDVKPGNVIVDRRGRATLIDFGIARAPGQEVGFVAGTRGYIAPERLTQGRTTAAADVYALGLLARDLLTAADTRPVPPEAAPIIERATSADPAVRHATAGAFSRELCIATAPRRDLSARARRELARAAAARARLGTVARTRVGAARTGVTAARGRSLGWMLARRAAGAAGSFLIGASLLGGTSADARETVALLARPDDPAGALTVAQVATAYAARIEHVGPATRTKNGGRWQMVVAVRNTGTAGWYRDLAGARAVLALVDEDDRRVAVAVGVDPGNWWRTDVPAVQTTAYVGPDQVGWFVVQGRAPSTGTHTLRLRPAIAGVGALGDDVLTLTLAAR